MNFRILSNDSDQLTALRIISYYYYLSANIYPYKTNVLFPILDSLPFIKNRFDSLMDVMSPKHKELKELKKFGIDYRKNITIKTVSKTTKQIIQRRTNASRQTHPNHLLSKRDFYNSSYFKDYVLKSMNNESILIDLLSSSEIRSQYIKIFLDFKNKEHNPSEYPVSLVTFLRHEFFLRELIND